MREIKFKAWLPAIKKMTYEHTLEELMNWNTKIEDNGTAVWLQYTGIRDKNGKEIYEGDVIKGERIVWTESQQFGGTAETTGIVMFANGRFILQDLETGAQPDLSLGSHYHEIIGNRFQHPELLEREGRT